MARQMKDSGIEWIGEIPNDWAVVPLQYHADLNTESLGEDTASDYEFDYVEIGSVTLEGGINEYEHVRFADAPSRARRVVKENDIIVSTVRTYLKAIAIVPAHENVIFSTGFAVLTPKDIDVGFLGFFLKSEYFVNMVTANSVGISYPAINASDLVKFKILLPSIEEQHRIAAFLDRQCAEIDAVVERTKATIEEYKKLKQAVITEAVTKGVRGARKMKDSGIEWIGEICDTYQVYRLKHLVSESLMYGANESGIPYDANLPRYIRITDITLDGHLKDDGKLSLSASAAEPYILKNNDILFARSGATVGKAFIYKQDYGKAAFAGYLIKASTNELVRADYVFYYTQSSLYEEWKKQIFVQATIQNIGADRYNNLPVVLPSVDEQQEIVAYLDEKCAALDTLIAKKAALLTELETYKKSLIYEYVTGKKEVL